MSSDHLTPRGGQPYPFAIPDGTPSRCNPITAPETCTALALEDPALLHGYRYQAPQ
ncbi:MAG: hypothetical protein IV100_07365 [Myxococcales bacterium]|nr:hypothetical protein [Myxococcales bacterium]